MTINEQAHIKSSRSIVRRARKTLITENCGLRANLHLERRLNAVLIERLEEATHDLELLRNPRPAITVVWPAPIRREIPQPIKGVR
jgi:hypothetical protein